MCPILYDGFCLWLLVTFHFLEQRFSLKIWLVIPELFRATIRKNPVFLSRFTFRYHVQVFSCEISLVCRFKYLYICFSFDFYFLLFICYCYHYYHYYLTSCEFLTPAFVDGFSHEYEWQQISLSLQESSQYSGWFQQCCCLDFLDSSPVFNSSRPLSKPLGPVLTLPVTTGLTITLMFYNFLSSLARSKYLSRLSFFFYYHSVIHWNNQTHNTQVLFFFVNYDNVWD